MKNRNEERDIAFKSKYARKLLGWRIMDILVKI